MFNSDKKKKALQKLEKAQREYESAGRCANEAVQSLYNTKKEAVIVIEIAERILKKQPDFGTENIRRIADAKSSIRLFQEAVQNEQIALEEANESIKDPTGKYVGAAGVGAAAGAAAATFGPTAAMAFATTFGTAATGTAISTLSGVAATNAALAWLGGGALAAGGGGMAAGSAFLAMFGPIGWAVGGITVGTTSFLFNWKNKKIAKQATELTKAISSAIEEINDKRKDIEASRKCILTETAVLKYNLSVNKISDNYTEIVEIIESLCEQINQKFPIKSFAHER